ncbi:gag-pol polyprotein [Tanacetum coccineum]|uniref:Gag-pol polyprotein n=1 Tax=Tanacetum coccineum TaxID=301880 RepID=A0ABQ4Z3Q0_9ASTR
MHTFYQHHPSAQRWTKDHPLEQVIGNPSQSIRTRRQLETDGEMCMFALTVSRTKPKNIKEAMADSAWIESMQEELHQFDRLDVWELVDRPLCKNVINLKWLWKNKRDEENTVDDVDIEEMDINWQIAMISIRMKKFYKKTGRRVRIEGNKPVGFDKRRLECFKCPTLVILLRNAHPMGQMMERRETHFIKIKDLERKKEDFLNKPLYSRFSKTDNFKGVPHPLTGDYTPKPQEEIDDSLYVYGKKGPQKPETSVSDDKFSENSVTSSEEVMPNVNTGRANVNSVKSNVNSVRHNVNSVRTNVNTGRSKQPVPTSNSNSFSPVRPQGNWGTAVKTSAGYNWRRTRPNSNYNSGSNFVRTVNVKGPQGRPKPEKAWTGNKDSPGMILRNCTRGNLLPLEHKVLFTETECLVVSPDFKMPDENQILLKVPRQHNMYSFDMKTPSLTKDYACLIAKATSDESKLWHRRGIKQEYSNARTSQHNGVAERMNRTLIEAARTMLANSLLPMEIFSPSYFTLNMKRGFRGVPRPLLPVMLPVVDVDQSAGPADQAEDQLSSSAPLPSSSHPLVISATIETAVPQSQDPTHPHVPEARTMKVEDLLHLVPNLITKVDSLETELKQTKLTIRKAIVKLVKKDIVDDPLGSKGDFVTPTKSLEEAQEEEISPTILEAAKTLSKVAPQRSNSVDKGKRYKRRKESKEEDISTGFKDISTGFEEVNTGFEKLILLEANAELTKEVLGKDLPEQDFAKRMVDLVNQRKRQFAKERAKEKRNKRMTQSQLRIYMSNYLKNQGTWKLSQLKKLKFEEIKEEFEKLVKQIDTFVPMNVEATKAQLKRYREGLQTENAPTTIIRANGADTVYMSFGAMLKDFTREDLIELYRLVMQKYGTNRPEDAYDRVLWSDLRTMFDPPLNEDAIWSLPLQQKIISWRYYDKCEWMLKMKLLDGKMNEVCYKLLKMIEKQAGVRK